MITVITVFITLVTKSPDPPSTPLGRLLQSSRPFRISDHDFRSFVGSGKVQLQLEKATLQCEGAGSEPLSDSCHLSSLPCSPALDPSGTAISADYSSLLDSFSGINNRSLAIIIKAPVLLVGIVRLRETTRINTNYH